MAINYVAVLVCGVAAMGIGSVWYGPLFGKAWREIMGVATLSAEQMQVMKKKMMGMYALQFILSLITAGILSVHISMWSDKSASGVGIAVCTWLGFIMTTEAGAALWSGKPAKTAWKMFFIAASSQLITFIVFGCILSLWK